MSSPQQNLETAALRATVKQAESTARIAAAAERVADTLDAVTAPALHQPGLAPRADGAWGVFCIACSSTSEDYVHECEVFEQPDWPPAVLVPTTSIDDTPGRMEIAPAG